MKNYYKCLLIIGCLVIFKPSAFALSDPEAFFVAPNGDDGNAGTIKAPFKTLAKARAATRNSAVKTVYLRAGTYLLTETFFLTSKDNGTVWMTHPKDPVNSAIINGNGLDDIIDILGGSQIAIEGLTVQNYTSRGIGIHGGTGWPKAAPNFDKHYEAAKGNIIRNNIVENGKVPAPGWDRAGINIEGQVLYTIIENNVVRNTTGYGIGIWSLVPGNDISGTIVRNNVILNSCSAARDGAAIYTCDRTAASTGIVIKNNFIRDYGSYENYIRAVYLDDETSNVIVSGNILSGSGRQPLLVHGGSNNAISGNIIDLGASGKPVVYNYAIRGSAKMLNNSFTGNVILSSYLIDSAGGAYRKTGKVADPDIRNNVYFNYAGGIVNTGGHFYELKDSFPLGFNPGISGWHYTIAKSSRIYKAPVLFKPIAGNWGPPGYIIPQKGTAPSCLLPGTNALYLHAESCNDMNGIVKKGMHINSCDGNDWIRFRKVDLGKGYKMLAARVAVDKNKAGKAEVRIGSPEGKLIGIITLTPTERNHVYEEQITKLLGGTGIQDICIVFAGGKDIGNFDYFKFY